MSLYLKLTEGCWRPNFTRQVYSQLPRVGPDSWGEWPNQQFIRAWLDFPDSRAERLQEIHPSSRNPSLGTGINVGWSCCIEDGSWEHVRFVMVRSMPSTEVLVGSAGIWSSMNFSSYAHASWFFCIITSFWSTHELASCFFTVLYAPSSRLRIHMNSSWITNA